MRTGCPRPRCSKQVCRSFGLVFTVGTCITSLYLASLSSVNTDINIRNIRNDVKDDKLLPVSRNLSSFHYSRDEIQHIAFLKVHKAASSTVQNILFRFGWRRNLTFVLPPIKNSSGYPHIISLREPVSNKNILEPPKGRNYDILCNHVYYSYESFVDVMPRDTVFIAIVREPFELFKSLLNFFRPVYIYKKIEGPNPVSQFLLNPTKYDPKGRISNSLTNNRMAQEFGFQSAMIRSYDRDRVYRHIKKLHREFQLVLVAELFEESIILMRRKLRWETKDIIFISQNVESMKNNSILPSYGKMELFKRYAKLDYDIYRYFYTRLREEIRKEGPDFDQELLLFTEQQNRITEFCGRGQKNDILFIDSSSWGRKFKVTKQLCDEIEMNEGEFAAKIRERQYGASSKLLTDIVIKENVN